MRTLVVDTGSFAVASNRPLYWVFGWMAEEEEIAVDFGVIDQ
jgi:hypothetical protein